MFVISAEVPSSSSVIMLSNSDSRQWVTMVLPPGPGPLLSHAEYTPEIDNMLSVMAVCTNVHNIIGDCCQFIKVWSHFIHIYSIFSIVCYI